MKNDRIYFTKREAEEQAAATRAKGKARVAHEQMAKRYHELAQPQESAE